MKRLIKKKPVEILEVEWTIDIYPKSSVIEGASILDTRSNEYQSFIQGMIANFGTAGYELYTDTQYTHPSNRKESNSWYYTFLKIEDYVAIRVIVHVRISDHPIPDKNYGTAVERRGRYLTRMAEELTKEYDLKDKPLTFPVDIIFDDHYCRSYVNALFYLKSQISEIDEEFEEWKIENPPKLN